MGTGWRRARNALGLNACASAQAEPEEEDDRREGVSVPMTPERVVPSEPELCPTLPLSSGMPPRSPSRMNPNRSNIRVSKSTCAICLETMKPGLGQALFTAECTHSFHFSCIASNVRHGNLVCPVCRAKWKEVPWQAPPEIPKEHHGGGGGRHHRHHYPRQSPSQVERVEVSAIEESPLEVEEERRRLDPVLRILDESIANSRGIRRSSSMEPNTYDDDEPLGNSSVGDAEVEARMAETDNFLDQESERMGSTTLERESPIREEGATTIGEGTSRSEVDEKERTSSDRGEESQGNIGTGNLKLISYTEIGALKSSEERDGFTVLVHLKAPQANQSARSSPSRESIMKGSFLSFQKSLSPTLSSPQLLDPRCRAPLDLVTVLDVSGSMAGTKLVLLKRAMGFVIRNLSLVDRLSVVVFSSTAKRLFPLRRMVEDGRQLALRSIEALVSTGGTNISEGLRKGAKVLEDRRLRNPVASIMLLSDGQDTYTLGHRGQPSSPTSRNGSELNRLLRGSVRHGRQYGQAATPVHTFGFGADHDAATMHSIAEVSGGTFSFIQTENVVQDAFAQCIGGLLSVVIQDAQLLVNTGNLGIHIKSIRAGSYESIITESASQGMVKLGDMYAEEERDMLLELKIPALEEVPAGDSPLSTLLRVGCSYKDPVSQAVRQTRVRQVCIARPEQVERDQETVSIEVDRQRNRLRTAQTIVEAGQLADVGDLASAQSLLQIAKAALENSLSSQVGDQLTSALEVEITEIQVRMANRQMYERTGRPYVLSAQSSHFRQRATTRGSFVDSHSREYQTPSMVDMILRSQTLSPGCRSTSASSTPTFSPSMTPVREPHPRSSPLCAYPAQLLMRRASCPAREFNGDE